LSASTLITVGKVVLSEAAKEAANKGLQIIDQKLESRVEMIKRKRGDQHVRESRFKPDSRKGATIQ